MSSSRRFDLTLGELLCESTPCVVALPYGDHVLAFQGLKSKDSSRDSTTVVRITRTTEVVNHTLGEHPISVGKALGLGIVVIGAIALGVALGMAENQQGQKADPTVRNVGLFGLGATLFGGTLFLASPRYYQDGATTQWAPAAKAAQVGAGFRF